MKRRACSLVLRIPVLALLSSPSMAALPALRLEMVCEKQLDSPVAMKPCGDASGRLFVVEQRGKIRIFKNGVLRPEVFLDLGGKLVAEQAGFDERGLLGLAFHPGYTTPESPGFRRFYVFYSAVSPNAPGTTENPVNCRSTVSEYKVSADNPDLADPGSERILFSFDKPQFNHNGGGLEFGPDGLLYFTTGDGGGSNDNQFGHTGGGASPRPTNGKGNAQDLTVPMGKMMRIDPLGTGAPGGQYSIPAGNPFADGAGGALPEIFAYGLRNCWRFSFDDGTGGTGRLFGADVGQGQVEEIDLITSAGNYGWRNLEGTFIPDFSVDAPALAVAPTAPIAQYAHPGVEIGTPALPQFGISVTGGYVYRGQAIPALAGVYLFADWSQSFSNPSGRLLGLEETAPGLFTLSQADVLGGNPLPYFVQGFGRDAAGELYVLGKTATGVSSPNPDTGLPAGVILKVTAVPPATTLTLTASRDTSIYEEPTLGNGAGDFLFSGATDPSKNDGLRRRALLTFDFSIVPPGAEVSSASLSLRMDKTITAAYAFSLHRMLANWGEGTANPSGSEGDGAVASAGDATWLKPVNGQTALWTTPGGDYFPEKSATTSVNAAGSYTWTSADMAGDVNDWLREPGRNFGWLLRPDLEKVKTTATGVTGQLTITVANVEGLQEGMTVTGAGVRNTAKIAAGGINVDSRVITLTTSNTGAVNGSVWFAAPSAKRFLSRTSTPAANRPRLTLNYVPGPVLTHRQSWERSYFFIGQFIDDTADTDGDSLPDGLEYAWGLSPKAPHTLAEGLTIDPSPTLAGQPLEAIFRRDPLAVDVTYRLQISGDLANWTTLAESAGGAVATGAGFVSEAEIAGQSPFRAVRVRDTSPAPGKRFVRLMVIR